MHQAEYKIKFVYKFVINGQCYEFQGERSFRLTFDGNVLAILCFLSWWSNNNMIMMFKIYKSCYTPFFTLNFKITYFCLNIFLTTKGITIHSFNQKWKPMFYLLNINSYHWNVIVVWAAIVWFFLYTMIIATCRATKTSIVSNTGFLSLICL